MTHEELRVAAIELQGSPDPRVRELAAFALARVPEVGDPDFHVVGYSAVRWMLGIPHAGDGPAIERAADWIAAAINQLRTAELLDQISKGKKHGTH